MWRFVHVTDPHLASQRDGIWNNRFLCTMMPDVMACLRKDLAGLKPDFMLLTGDIVSAQTRAAMFEARDEVERLGVPYYPMGGNHDFVLEESRAWFLDAFNERLPEPRTYYSFSHKNLHFCVLDAWWMWSDGSLNETSEASVMEDLDQSLEGARWAVPPHILDWLEEDLALHADTATVIAVHYPVVPIPMRLHRPEFNNGGCLENGDLLLACFANHPQVKAIFSGHVHMHFVEQVNRLTQIVTGALPEYPTEFRDVQVYSDRMEIQTLGLSNGEFAQRSLLPGKEWTAGERCDRKVIVPLM
ncbi:MAG: metallophosphoesterase [Candidatus Hydrogenedentes bacterium]|nr:metallophosphoesterase [Candidatus Hydrogenedentota bacterium]